jgi:hypothetical protein
MGPSRLICKIRESEEVHRCLLGTYLVSKKLLGKSLGDLGHLSW